MHIFMTNDDGFEAPGIIELAKSLSRLGRVTVTAPDNERSSCSSSLSLRQFLRLCRQNSFGENIDVFSCSGTPADCCKLALEGFLKGDEPDLIVSGVNDGFNCGSDCLYSGTVAGALEGMLMGIPSLAVSAETTKDSDLLGDVCSFTTELIEKYFMRAKFTGTLNLNVPQKRKEPLSCSSLKICRLGMQRYENVIRKIKDSSGRPGFWISGKALASAPENTDVYWAHRGYATLTPVTWNQTDETALTQIEEMLKK